MIFNKIRNFLTLSSTEPENEWSTWESWQAVQPPSHFQSSIIYDNYVKQCGSVIPLINSVLHSPSANIYKYCFGDFTIFILNRGESIDITE